MNIVIVGGNGFVGKELVQFANGRGHEITVVGSECDVFSSSGEEYVRGILSKSESMVFLAARRPIKSFDIGDYTYNVCLADKYLRIAAESQLKSVVITSSRSVYSGDNLPWKEDHMGSPLSLYGASKQAVDAIALLYNNMFDMNIKCLRLAQVIGLGEHKGFLLNTMIDNAITGRKQTVYGTGAGKRQYVYIVDVCDAIMHCIENKTETGIFNIGMNYNVSIIELAEIINDVFDNRAGIEINECKTEDKSKSLMDVTKAEHELQWTAKYGLVEAFKDIKARIV